MPKKLDAGPGAERNSRPRAANKPLTHRRHQRSAPCSIIAALLQALRCRRNPSGDRWRDRRWGGRAGAGGCDRGHHCPARWRHLPHHLRQRTFAELQRYMISNDIGKDRGEPLSKLLRSSATSVHPVTCRLAMAINRISAPPVSRRVASVIAAVGEWRIYRRSGQRRHVRARVVRWCWACCLPLI